MYYAIVTANEGKVMLCHKAYDRFQFHQELPKLPQSILNGSFSSNAGSLGVYFSSLTMSSNKPLKNLPAADVVSNSFFAWGWLFSDVLILGYDVVTGTNSCESLSS